MTDTMVSAGQAARRLGVSPATIQRWVDAGTISAVRTIGGHRRIPASEIRRILAEARPTHLPEPIARWTEVLLRADLAEVRAALTSAHKRKGRWWPVAEEVAAAIAELGRMYEAGSCQIFQNRGAVEAIGRASASIALGIKRKPEASSAVLLTVEGERHTLGLHLAELVLAEARLQTHWIGEGPPVEELEDLAKLRSPDLFIVSASTACLQRTVLAYQSSLEKLAVDTKVKVILAGAGSWSATQLALRIDGFMELDETLDTANLARRGGQFVRGRAVTLAR